MRPPVRPFALDPPQGGWAPNARPTCTALGRAAQGCNGPCGKETKVYSLHKYNRVKLKH